ncbi:MAG: ABC transporter permease subunit [Thermoanaerobaculia bacterium]|nr:ABC transporter permease subunit [Thermoanaerobaculia bacterium]
MAPISTTSDGGLDVPARPGVAARKKARRFLADRIARRLVYGSGVLVILAIAAILFVLFSVALPLLLPPKATPHQAVDLGFSEPVLAFVTDEYRENGVACLPSGFVQFSLVESGPGPTRIDTPGIGEAKIVQGLVTASGGLAAGLSDGRLLPVDVAFETSFEGSKRQIRTVVTPGEPLVVDEGGRPTELAKYLVRDGSTKVAARVGPRDVAILETTETANLMGESTREEKRELIQLQAAGEITALAIDARGDDLFLGTSTGEVIRFDRRAGEDRGQKESVFVARSRTTAVTALGFLNGDRTLIAGDAAGGVVSLQMLQPDGRPRTLTPMNQFEAHKGRVVGISPSRRDKGFVTIDDGGEVKVHYGTTGKTLLSLRAEGARLTSTSFAPKADGVLAARADGKILHWSLQNPHPEITLRTLFGKVWYEGYNEPGYVWQSTGGTDDFEAKFSLTPLIFGTLKGTFYALIVAIPLALFGALYTSQFLHPNLKSIIKPGVEIMAALPSVVLGFVAGLWLAPAVERVVPGILATIIVVPVFAFAASAVWERVPTALKRAVPAGYEILFLLPVVLLALWVGLQIGHQIEHSLLHGDYRAFFLKVLGLTYDQRNSVVVGLAMGFAVIPIIFTVAEDSLSSVPKNLTAGSLALGATRWQTALRTVLPTASPGIFSAIMIGFGRAVGETMIVLMATGNTPVMDWSPFNGFRAMSANVAVELPEAPEGGTLFRVLFVAALLLFAMTFVVNTAAELVRLRLRKKYRTYE